MRVAPLLLALVAASAPVAALAQDADRWRVQATAATQYVSKGAGKSDERPHGSLRVERLLGSKGRMGVWAGNVTTSQGADAEVHLYAGVKPKLGPVGFDFIAFYKTLPGTRSDVQEDFAEFRADASVPVGPVKLRQRVEFSPDSYGATEAAWWLETDLSAEPAEGWTVSAAVGRREQDGGVDYTAWNAGASFAVTERVEVDLRWYDTDAHERGEQYEGRLVAEAVIGF